MHRIDPMTIEQECAKLIIRYAYLNDERNFEALADLFTADAVLYRPSAPTQAITGRADILSAFRKRPADVITFHICSDILIEIEDDVSATGRSRILLFSGSAPADGSRIPTDARPPVPGVFHDRFRWTDGGWKFAERRGVLWFPA